MKTPLNVYEITRHLCDDLTGIVAEEVLNRVRGLNRARDFRGLATILDHFDVEFLDVRTMRFLLQVQAFFKKNAQFADEESCMNAAQQSFLKAEKVCRIANRRLDYYYVRPDRLDPGFLLLIEKAQRFIAETLGDYRSFHETIPDLVKVTSGATYSLARSNALPPERMLKRIDVTPRCVPYLSSLYRFFGYKKPRVDTTLWNRVEFVPKNWKTHRTIACEPTGNVPFQLAFDGYVKSRLLPRGIDLRNQSKNQRHAYVGSVDNSYCTIDLSMASDTLAFNAVAWLLPESWFQFLCDVRSPCYYSSDMGHGQYAKFSSMGNGATFALETLIFASFVRAAGSRKGLAYGDDLTIEPEYVSDLLKLLAFFGFTVNKEKSYFKGPYRESCGEHYFRGQSVTPFFVRSIDSWDKPTACHNVNGIRAVTDCCTTSKDVGSVWTYLLSFVDENKLPLSAVSEDTMSGVHVHPHMAYRSKLISDLGIANTRKGKKPIPNGILATRAYVRKGTSKTYFDSRALALWHLRAFQRAQDRSVGTRLFLVLSRHFGRVEQGQAIETSRYTASSNKYVRKWVAWHMPSKGNSDCLFAFTELLLRPKS